MGWGRKERRTRKMTRFPPPSVPLLSFARFFGAAPAEMMGPRPAEAESEEETRRRRGRDHNDRESSTPAGKSFPRCRNDLINWSSLVAVALGGRAGQTGTKTSERRCERRPIKARSRRAE